MLKYQVLYALFILSCSLVYAARDQTFFNLPYFPTYGENDRVVSCGSQYRDSSKFYCSSCPSNQEIDPDTIGGDKQYEGCRCQLGFATVNNDCSTVRIFSKHMFFNRINLFSLHHNLFIIV